MLAFAARLSVSNLPVGALLMPPVQTETGRPDSRRLALVLQRTASGRRPARREHLGHLATAGFRDANPQHGGDQEGERRDRESHSESLLLGERTDYERGGRTE